MKKLFALYLFVLLDLFLVSINSVNANTNNSKMEIYPLTTVVTNVNPETDTVTCVDFNRNLWKFKGTEDWCVNDICSMIMSTNGTEDIHDDKILFVKYDGYID